jgi:hypothetical protein
MPEPTVEELQKNLTEWAQNQFMSGPGIYKFNWPVIRTEGANLGLAEQEIDDVIEDLQRISASKQGDVMEDVKIGAKVDADNLRVGDMLRVVVPIQTISMDGQQAELMPKDQIFELIGIGKNVYGVHVEGMEGDRQVPKDVLLNNAVHVRQEESGQTDKLSKSPSMLKRDRAIRERASAEDCLSLDTLKGMAVQAMTYTDPGSRIRAAYLMGMCTTRMWKEAVSDIKKACGKEIEEAISKMSKWGTVRLSPGAINDVMIKVLQSKKIYPYPDLLLSLAETMQLEPKDEGGTAKS